MNTTLSLTLFWFRMKEIKLLGLHNTVAPEDKNTGLFFLSIHLGIKGVTNNFRSDHKGEQSCSLHTTFHCVSLACTLFCAQPTGTRRGTDACSPQSEPRPLLCYWGREARGRQSSLKFSGDQKDISAYKHVSAIAEQTSLSSLQSHLTPWCL